MLKSFIRLKSFGRYLKHDNKVYRFSSDLNKINYCYYLRMPLAVCLMVLFVVSSCVDAENYNDQPRLVITSPEVGEILYLLQGTENVVGVTREVNYPEAFAELPQVGRFGAVSLERIIELNPTLVITSGLEQQQLAGELGKIGINTLVVYPLSLSQMLDSIEQVANELHIPDRGKAVRDSLEAIINSKVSPQDPRPRVYVEIYGNPIMSVSSESFIGEVISIAGGENIFPSLPREYSMIRQEKVIAANPQIIIITYPGVTAEHIKNRKGWSQIEACRYDRIYTLDEINPDLLLRAGPRVVAGIEMLQAIFAK